jgi:hypothetical protein
MTPMTHERYIVVLTTSWGPKHGGINSFNYDLTLALPGVLSEHGVICVTLNAPQRDITRALRDGVTLISLGRNVGEFNTRWWEEISRAIQTKTSLSKIDWWVGHDIKSGDIAFELMHRTKVGGVALIMHMFYDDYAFQKHPSPRNQEDTFKDNLMLLGQRTRLLP